MRCQYRNKLHIQCIFTGVDWMTLGGISKKFCNTHALHMLTKGWLPR